MSVTPPHYVSVTPTLRECVWVGTGAVSGSTRTPLPLTVLWLPCPFRHHSTTLAEHDPIDDPIVHMGAVPAPVACQHVMQMQAVRMVSRGDVRPPEDLKTRGRLLGVARLRSISAHWYARARPASDTFSLAPALRVHPQEASSASPRTGLRSTPERATS